jgi:hypothetical protein
MPMTNFTFVGRWDQFSDSVNPAKFGARERAAMRKATELNGMYVAGQIKRSIRKSWTRNAALTRTIKGSTKTLVDMGTMFKAVTYQVINYSTVFAGITKQAKSSTGGPLVNVVEMIHEGGTINVTTKMRAMFWYLWMVSSGRMDQSKLTGRAMEIWERIGGKRRIIKPLNPSTTVIRIPSRPFIRKVFENRNTRAAVKRNWSAAVAKAVKAP